MNRFTYFDKEKQTYTLIQDIKSKETLIQIIGTLEDSKERKQLSTFADYLINLRKEMGLSQREFARKANIARSTIAKYETNKSLPSLETLYNLAMYADVPLGEVQAIHRQYICNFDDSMLDLYFEVNRGLFNIELGLLLACERRFNKLSKSELAKKLNFKTNAITKFESGKKEITWPMCTIFAQALNSVRLNEISKRLCEKR